MIAAAAVTHRSRAIAVCGEHPPNGGQVGGRAEQRPPIRRLETEALVLFRQCGFDFRNRCCRACGDDHLVGFVIHDAAQTGEIEHIIAFNRAAETALGAVADNLERAPAYAGCANRLHHICFTGNSECRHQNRGSSAWRICPCFTCACPCSMQADKVGNTLPGLSRPPASKAHFSRCCCARSASENISGIRSRFSTPTPCSPVSTPPTLTHSRRISAPKASARSSSSSFITSKMISGWMLPSPAWNTLQKPR